MRLTLLGLIHAAVAAVLISGCGGATTTVTQTSPSPPGATTPTSAAGASPAACGQVLNGLTAFTPDAVHLVAHRSDRAGYAKASADLDMIRSGLVSLRGDTKDAMQKAQLDQFVGLVDGLKQTVMAGAAGDYLTAGTQLVSGIGRIRQVRSGVASVCTG